MGQSAAPLRCRSATAEALRAALVRIGMCEADPGELGPARALAASLINPAIASEESLRTLYARAQAGFYVVREYQGVTGVLALAFLNRAGLEALTGETFDPLTPRIEHVAAWYEEPAAIYGWGVAGANRTAAAIASLGSQTACELSPCPFFARAATEAGLRLLERRLHLVPYPGSPSGLLWREHSPARRAA